MAGKIIHICQYGSNLAALSDDGEVFISEHGDFGSVAWTDITPYGGAQVYKNPEFKKGGYD